MEVSSPGIERPLKTIEAVERFSGQRALVATHEAIDGRRNWEGTLLGPDQGRIGVRTEDGIEQWFDWCEVKNARLVMPDPWKHGAAKPGAAKPGARRGGAR